MAKQQTGLGLLVLGLFGFLACSTGKVDLGDPDESTNESAGGTPETGSGGQTSDAKTAGSATGGATGLPGTGGTINSGVGSAPGTWVGYVESHTWDDSTDVVTLVYGAETGGYLRLGNRELLNAASDPAACYPEQQTDDSSTSFDRGPFTGFEYPLREISQSSSRLVFSAASDATFQSYCELQTSYLDEVNGGYLCLPNRHLYGNNGHCYLLDRAPAEGELEADVPMTEYDCCQTRGCLGTFQPCNCDATGCTASAVTVLTFDGAFTDSGDLTGTITADDSYTVRLTRQ